MKATNLKDPNVSSNPQAGSGLTVQPGSLAIGASLTAEPRAQLLSIPTDANFTAAATDGLFEASSIASGAPDEFTWFM